MNHPALHMLLTGRKPPPPHERNRAPKPPIHDVQNPPPPGFIGPGYPRNPLPIGPVDTQNPTQRLGNSYWQMLNLLAALGKSVDYPS